MLSVEEKKKVIIAWIKKRIEKNKNLILVINGETGSGKTYAALRLAEDLSKELGNEFTIKNNMDFNFVSLLEKMEYVDGNKKPGTVFLFEEVGSIGSGAGSKQWQSKANQMFSSFGQTSRHLRQIFIMTCPLFTNLQSDTRKLCHMQWEMAGINYQNKLSYVRPFRLQVNQTSGKMYMKYLRFKKDGRGYRLKRLDMEMPSQSIVEEYEKAKHKFTSTLNRSIIEKTHEEANKKHGNAIVDKELVQMYLEQGKSVREIATKFGVTTQGIYKIKTALVTNPKPFKMPDLPPIRHKKTNQHEFIDPSTKVTTAQP